MDGIVAEKTNKQSGVYASFNPITLKVYIGETTDFYRRWAEHIGSIYGLESSSNKNMEEEKIKSFEIFPIIFSKYDKKDNKEDKIKEWIIHETIIMYIFKKHNIELYNGNNGKDNTGKVSRSFLFDNTMTHERMKEEMIKYLNQCDNESTLLEGTEFENWNALFVKIEEEIDNCMIKRFGTTLSQFLESNVCQQQRKKIWDQRMASVNEKDFYIITEENANEVYKELYDLYLSKILSFSELDRCGLKKMDVNLFSDLAKTGALDRIIVSKFGKYYDQSVSTILSTKVYDIQHNQLNDLKGLKLECENKQSGICFWALKRLDVINTRDFLSYHGEDKTPRYVIMLYTPSQECSSSSKDKKSPLQLEHVRALNPYGSEDIEAFFKRCRGLLDTIPMGDIAKDKFAFGYADKEKEIKNKRGIRFQYPQNMFPEIIEKSEINKALLISDLSYVNMHYKDAKCFYDVYHSYLKDGSTNYLSKTLGARTSHCCALLDDGKRDELANLLKNQDIFDESDIATYVIAKLEYPYIVALASNEIV